MSRRREIPLRGDVPSSMVAERLGLSLPDFETFLSDLVARGFPAADPTTGRFCIEAVDRWRMGRHPKLFPELARVTVGPVDAAMVFAERVAKVGHHGAR